MLNTLEIVRIVSAALTSCGIFGIIFSDSIWWKVLSAVLSFVTLGVNSVFKAFSIQDSVGAHSVAAVKLLELRDLYQHLLMEVKIEHISFEELDSKYVKLEERKHLLYKELPRTTDKAVGEARSALNVNKDNEITDEEIDSNLPKSLQKN
jgi:hypothetical protein